MPGMDGFELLQSLGKQRINIPVILMSGHVEEGTIEQSKELGALTCLSKPFSFAQLTEVLGKVI